MVSCIVRCTYRLGQGGAHGATTNGNQTTGSNSRKHWYSYYQTAKEVQGKATDGRCYELQIGT